MMRFCELFFKRYIGLILAVCIVYGFLSLVSPTAGRQESSRKSPGALYQRFKFDELPFEVVIAREEVRPAPKNHIAFIKVHKSGSTTTQNIFLRYGWSNNLTFVLPPAKNNFGYPNIISLRESLTKNNTLAPPAGKYFEILCNHVIYNKEAFQKYMPKDTMYIGIIREPYEMFKSTLNYLRPAYIFRKIKTKHPVSEYLKSPAKFEPKNPVMSFTNNRMAVELGCPQEVVSSRDSTKIQEFLNELDKTIDVMIIAEYFEESIIMLRRRLNWSTKDVLYLDKNIAYKKNETDLVKPYDRQKYKAWAKVDYALYGHFFKRLRREVREAGEDFDEEILYFRELRKMTSEFCSQTPRVANAKLFVKKSSWSDEFVITNTDCMLLKKQEISFVQDIRIRQYGTKDA